MSKLKIYNIDTIFDNIRQNDAYNLIAALTDGLHPHTLNKAGRPLLVVSANFGCLTAIDALLAHGAEVNFCPRGCSSALSSAARFGHTAVVRRLLEAGADVNAAAEGGWTALMQAAAFGHTEVAELLLGVGADRAHKCKGRGPYRPGQTALDAARRGGHSTIIKLLQVLSPAP